MTSGTTEYTREQILDGLYLYSLNTSEAFAKARKAYDQDVKRVADKLKKAGISMSEFTAYVTEKERPNGTANTNVLP